MRRCCVETVVPLRVVGRSVQYSSPMFLSLINAFFIVFPLGVVWRLAQAVPQQLQDTLKQGNVILYV